MRKLPQQQQLSFRQKMANMKPKSWKSSKSSQPKLERDCSDNSSRMPSSHNNLDSSIKSSRGLFHLEKPVPKRQLTVRGMSMSLRVLSRGLSSKTADTFRSLETISDRVNPTYAKKTLSEHFPMSAKTEQYLIRRPRTKGELTTIENQRGVIVGVVEETHYGRKLLKDADGKVCAMILCHDVKMSTTKFSICGLEPVVHKQTMKYDQVGFGYYKWAQVKNAGGFGGTITLKHTKDEVKLQSEYTYCTKMFGSVFRIKKTRGHVVLDEDKKECAKLIPLHNTGRAISIGPKMDVALMLCYAVIIDEILESRIR